MGQCYKENMLNKLIIALFLFANDSPVRANESLAGVSTLMPVYRQGLKVIGFCLRGVFKF